MSTDTTMLPLKTERAQLFARLSEDKVYDLAVVGGGATGLGVALDAAARGFSVVLMESHDFAKGTSSRATKLVHGGVRYLAQGNIALVREALHERATLLNNAGHIAQPLAFVMPSYKLLDMPFYGIGLTIYDALAGKSGLGCTKFLSTKQTQTLLPTVQMRGLKGGVKYWDGQFDDARLALALARTAAREGALLLNYCPVRKLIHENGRVAGLVCEDGDSNHFYEVRARCVINATGPWVDTLRDMDSAESGRAVRPIVTPSQGVHIVVDRDFLPGDHALLIPKTADGRVLFAVPWLGKVILGTTDTPRHDVVREPVPFAEELAFILKEAGHYLNRQPTMSDVRSMWAGLRPLVTPQEGDSESTKRISREHTVLTSESGLITMTGGKWTTYRAMAEDMLNVCFDSGALPRRPGGITQKLPLVGAPLNGSAQHRIHLSQGLHSYGSEADFISTLPGADQWLFDGLSIAMVRFAIRYEYAETVEDVLARRSRLLFLDARSAAAVAPHVATILQEELGKDEVGLQAFLELTRQYLPSQH